MRLYFFLNMNTRIIILSVFFAASFLFEAASQNWEGKSSVSQRQMEYLDRGLVAVWATNPNRVFLSWRFLGSDDRDVKFNVYRDGVLANGAPLSGATNYQDASGVASSSYAIGVVNSQGEEIERSASVEVWSSFRKTLQLQRPISNMQGVTYSPNDIAVGDLDGDGQYELIVKWDPSNSADNSQRWMTDKTYIDAYKLDGTFVWRIDLGVNIRSGAHYTQMMVYDLDGDGRAEIVMKTAPGTVDGVGKLVRLGDDDPFADYRNAEGIILRGPEYLTVFDGYTGAAIHTIPYKPSRDGYNWGDNYGNRQDRFLACIAYLDHGDATPKPSVVMCRGYYTRSTLAAYKFEDGQLHELWFHDSPTPGQGAYGQGNHQLAVADVDGDGFDEIIYGAAVINHDGTLKVRTGLGHGDALHVSDMNPDRPGYEVFQITEETGAEQYNHAMYCPNTGAILWHSSSTGNDNGRGMAAHLDAAHRGFQVWSSAESGLYNMTGTRVSTSKPNSTNFRIYWDGDLQDELLDGQSNPSIRKYRISVGNSTIVTFDGARAVNGTKANPCISADLFGDWREEVIYYNNNNPSQLFIYTTTTPTTHRLYTLMHDPVYRLSIAWQNVAYNQPPHLGFYIGDGLDNIPYPYIHTPQVSALPSAKVYLAALEELIEEAQKLHDDSPKGLDIFQYPVEAFPVLQAAIDVAQTYLESVDPDTDMHVGQSGLNAAGSTLRQAVVVFQATQIRSKTDFDENKYYTIYSWGRPDGSEQVAGASMTKKFLYSTGNSLLYYIGTNYQDTEAHLNDPLRKQTDTQWQIIRYEEKAERVVIRNRATGKYLRVAGTSDTPVPLHLVYEADDNNSPAFVIWTDDYPVRPIVKLQVGSTEPQLQAFSHNNPDAPPARVRMRWVIEEAMDIPVTQIIIAESLKMEVGEEKTLQVTVLPVDATEPSLEWSSSDTYVATVENGAVTALSPGIAYIEAIASNGVSAICVVTVGNTEAEPVAVTSVTFDQETLTMNIGDEETLVATVLPDDAADKSLVWSSGDPTVASVEDGAVTALKAGTTTITATAHNGEKAECAVTVATLNSIDVFDALSDISVFPNPATETITISGLVGGELIAIMDMAGRTLMQIKTHNTKESISVGSIPAGTYLVRITKGNAEKMVKIVVN